MSHTIEHVVITRALELLQDGWTSHTFARDKLGNVVSPLFSGAVKFCALGALMRAGHEVGIDIYDLKLSPFFRACRRSTTGGEKWR